MPNRLGIASMSLGRPGIHSLPYKLRVAAQYGYTGIELFFDDLDHYARSHFSGNHISAAHAIAQLCASLHLTIICLQPFSFFEGLTDRTQTEFLLTEKLPKWFTLARILGTDMIQVPSNFAPENETTGDRDVIVGDLQRLADLGAKESPPFRFVYEALAWGTRVSLWDEAYEIVCKVDRTNFGICLDTFNLAGRVYADPGRADGMVVGAEEALRESLRKLRETVDVKKVFYVQVVDGERLERPLDEEHEFHVPGQPVRMNWSRNARLFAFEEERGGYLPIEETARAFFDTGFEGWVSLELFSRTLAEEGRGVVVEHARRGLESWKELVRRLQFVEAYPPVDFVVKEVVEEREVGLVQGRL
ncbi:sugar phosphate isomerase/epimerase family protein [Aspergillus ibericus CBS 121593]|uniref:4-hydroxyphenylpyruvate dioxygenase n=1 Tax=Aspergillus ibericus CBS 121593 TaxID=1448316 RepID=A0A395GQV4_9EURO|nr:4-hydroxyphenylpyruvate dioxygenase [Aspergillus ibericus CBS 121593]RAK97107.1 4-hydroxyphenylpyruvate dioxygenase [Aspergillus ibericus CBS 121593]